MKDTCRLQRMPVLFAQRRRVPIKHEADTGHFQSGLFQHPAKLSGIVNIDTVYIHRAYAEFPSIVQRRLKGPSLLAGQLTQVGEKGADLPHVAVSVSKTCSSLKGSGRVHSLFT